MPLYTVSTRQPLSARVKERAATMITDVHCAHTQAPRTFVNVYFSQNVPLPRGIDLHVFGTVRGGRTTETNERIKADMVDQFATLTGLSPRQVGLELFPVPASWVMEGGTVLPEPGDEADWLQEHRGPSA